MWPAQVPPYLALPGATHYADTQGEAVVGTRAAVPAAASVASNGVRVCQQPLAEAQERQPLAQ